MVSQKFRLWDETGAGMCRGFEVQTHPQGNPKTFCRVFSLSFFFKLDFHISEIKKLKTFSVIIFPSASRQPNWFYFIHSDLSFLST